MRSTLPLLFFAAALAVAQEQDPRELFERAYFQEHALKQLDQAITTYRRVAELAGNKDKELAGRALVRVAACEQARGRDVEAREVLDEVLRKFADVPAVKQAAEQLLGEGGGPRRSLRIHDIEFLLTRAPNFSAPDVRLVPPAPAEQGGGAGTGRLTGAVLTFDEYDEAPEGRAFEPDQLVELIQKNIAEDTWANERTSLSIEGNRLLVVQTAEVQGEIARYLDRLRALRGRVVTFEVTLAALEGPLAAELARASTGGPLPEEKLKELEQRLRAGAAQGAILLERHRLSAYDRQQVHVAALRQIDYLGQQLVNQTGVLPMVNPVVENGHEGFLVELRPVMVGQADHLLVEVEAAWSQWSFRDQEVEAGDMARPAEQRAERVQLPRAELFELTAVQLARAGGTLLAGAVDTPRGFDGLKDPRLVLLVRPELSAIATGKPDAAGSVEPRPLRIHDVSLLTYRRDEDEGSWPHGAEEPISADTLLELVQQNVASESWTSNLNSIQALDDGALAVVNTPEVQAQVESFLLTLRRARGRSVTVEAAWVALGQEDLARIRDAGKSAGQGAYVIAAGVAEPLLADAARVRGWASASTWEGRPVKLREVSHRRYLSGHERSAGGTGEVVSSVTTPLVDVARGGATFRARAKLLPDLKHVTLDLWLDLKDLETFEVVTTTTGPIELPRRRETSLRSAVSFPLDQVLVVGAGTGRGESGGRATLLVRVRSQNLLGGE